MHKLLYLFIFLSIPCWTNAQVKDLRYEDYVYQENIHSVRLHLVDSVLSDPIISLNSPSKLTFSFDDLNPNPKNYLYTLTHCDSEWKPSDIDELDYIDGFLENSIDEYQFSQNTIAEYTNFFIELPNEDLKWTKSGNYLLQVYEDDGDRELVITRRFIVTEQLMKIEGNFVRPSNPDISTTHHNLNFSVKYENVRVSNAQSEIKVNILQNGRWDNVLSNIQPRYNRNNQLVYDQINTIIFPAGKEFRHLDLRSFEYKSDRIAQIDEYDDYYEVLLKEDKPRPYKRYVSKFDINGKYAIENLDLHFLNSRTVVENAAPQLVTLNRSSQIEEHARNCDYGQVYFSLRAPIPFEGKDVYLFGGLTDWQLLPEFKFKYNASKNAYEGEAFLKQGYYNYIYALVDQEDPKKVDFTEIEGDWHETENNYTILVYWRPFGARFDRVAAVRVFNSLEIN